MFSDEDYPETDDGFGPGSDLVLSVLGIVVLLIGISRVYAMFDLQLVRTLPESVPRAEIPVASSESRAADLDRTVADLRSQLDAARMAAGEYQRQLATASAQPNRAALEQQLADLKDQLTHARDEVAVLEQKGSVREHEIAGLGQELDSARDAAERYRQQLAVPQPRQMAPHGVLAFVLKGQDASFFLKDSAELRPPAQMQIEAGRVSIARVVLESGANFLEIRGYASPEPPADRDLSLSAERAIAVLRYLRRLGVPDNCMSVSGMGRGRSSLLYDLYLKRDQANTVQSWDGMFGSAQGDKLRGRLEDALADERRVEIVAVADPAAKCTNDELLHALRP
jgi:outer membrane protein OmpA-like peptidoglycan-associated protein